MLRSRETSFSSSKKHDQCSLFSWATFLVLRGYYSLNVYFSRRFLYYDSSSFSPYKPLQNVDFSKVGNMQFFFRNCTRLLTRTQGKKFEVTFLVKIASKGTSLSEFYYYLHSYIFCMEIIWPPIPSSDCVIGG